MTKPYHRFASVYDQMGADDHSVSMTRYCARLFRKFDIHPDTGLDLACGTGTALKIFSEQGIAMSGLDASPHMLAVASSKTKGLNIPLYRMDLSRFRIRTDKNSRKTRQFDLVTSFYDSLNYLLTEQELRSCYQSVYKHLAPGGWFIFDMNTPLALKTIWGSQTFTGIGDNLVWIWQNDYDRKTKTAACQTTFFRRHNDYWERFDECHIERGYSNRIIRSLLKNSGFQIRGFYECFTIKPPARQTDRIAVIARKPREK